MDKREVAALLAELNNVENIPASVQAQVDKIQSYVNQYSEKDFERLTNGVVTQSAGEQPLLEEDPRFAMSELYTELNEYTKQNRDGDMNAKLTSALYRLRGMIDAYARDFP
ncbi:hypothetical protein [Paenibacillus turpanensis]|uniref:hypothetical protein n=1 Tax=Paenibacillus turpanensis TaxID=2689078 RepID=UPI00140B8F4C|nr:hypothetical protein [Paenibacillus turpanensis]